MEKTPKEIKGETLDAYKKVNIYSIMKGKNIIELLKVYSVLVKLR